MKQVFIKRSSIEGSGLFAGEPIFMEEIIQRIDGVRIRKRLRNPGEAKRAMNWIGIGKETWIKTAGTPFRYINHSCEPNAAIVGTKTVIALKNIKKGEEIVMDYSMTDADPLWNMECRCGTKSCRKIISSIQSVPLKVFKRHMPHVPRNFQRIYLKHYILGPGKNVLLGK